MKKDNKSIERYLSKRESQQRKSIRENIYKEVQNSSRAALTTRTTSLENKENTSTANLGPNKAKKTHVGK